MQHTNIERTQLPSRADVRVYSRSVDGHEVASADAGAVGVDDADAERRGDGGVDRGAAEPRQDVAGVAKREQRVKDTSASGDTSEIQIDLRLNLTPQPTQTTNLGCV